MNNPTHYQSQDNTESSQRLFERRVYCGVCGGMMMRTTLRRHSPERAFHCPVCQKDVNSRNYHFRYPKRVQITFNYGDWMEPLLDCIEETKIIESEQEPN